MLAWMRALTFTPDPTVHKFTDAQHIFRLSLVTMAIHGFQKVKASITWAASVATTAVITQTTFLPVLSTMKPRTGDAGAEMMYTILRRQKCSITKMYAAEIMHRFDVYLMQSNWFQMGKKSDKISHKNTTFQHADLITNWVGATCWQLWLQLERSWIFQWRTLWKSNMITVYSISVHRFHHKLSCYISSTYRLWFPFAFSFRFPPPSQLLSHVEKRNRTKLELWNVFSTFVTKTICFGNKN